MDVVSVSGGGEQAVAQCIGDEWINMEQHSTVWRSKLEEMINWTRSELLGLVIIIIMKLGLSGPEQMARPAPKPQQPESLMMKPGLLESQITLPRHNPTSQCPLVEMGPLRSRAKRTTSADATATAVAKHVDEGCPSGIAKYSATAKFELGEFPDEESSAESEPGLTRLIHDAMRLLESSPLRAASLG